jgi:hypothetical protein
MVLKTVKGKIAAGTVAVALVSGMGAAFANTDAGTNLKNWYDGQFNSSVAKVNNDSLSYANGKVGALNSEYNTLKSGAVSSINSTRDTEISGTTTDINNAKQAHIDGVTAKQSEIEGYLSAQFDGVFSTANGFINIAGAQAQQYANRELTNVTGNTGGAALITVENDLTKITNDAKSELEMAIGKAKTELQTKLNSETTQTTDEVKAAIDTKIVELRELITAKKVELVEAQQKLITEKAAELEAAAKNDLDAIVSGIDN